MAWTISEFETKLIKVRSFMQTEGIPGILITTQTNFLWLTGGRPYINSAVEKSCADLLITNDQVYLIANNIEGERLMAEELAPLAIEKNFYNWWDNDGLSKSLQQITAGSRIASDRQLGVSFNRLRWSLLPEEQQRYEDTGKAAAEILAKVAMTIQPGSSEGEIAQMIRQTALDYAVEANVALVAVDERTFQYRHPLPTDKRLKKYAMLVLSGQKYGLYASATRLVHFGKPPRDLQERFEKVLRVDGAYIGATVPGTQMKDIFSGGRAAYAAAGVPNEWQYHHQGGMTGYNSREFRATGENEERVQNGQAYAWNPTIAGVKSEDTILVKNNKPVVVTVAGEFPTVNVACGNFVLQRPAILVR